MKSDAQKSTELELAETALRELVRKSELDYEAWRIAAREAITGDAPLPGATPQETRALISEPHFWGWLHQHLVESGRVTAFAEHHHREAKHGDSTTTTQLYTPRWVADVLARELMDLTGPAATCLDPACGGGQLLLAWIDEARRRGLAEEEAFRRVRGVDLDPQAVDACREVLRTHAARVIGHLPDEISDHIESNIIVADGIFDKIDRADAVLMNPPYMGSRSMDPALKTRIRERFQPFHHDLYTAFIARALELAEVGIGVLAQQTVWYLSRYRKARERMLEAASLAFFAHLGPGVFASLSGEKASVVAFVQSLDGLDSTCRFVDFRDHDRSAMAAALQIAKGRALDVDSFATIPGAPIAHWLEPELISHFGGPRLGDIAELPGGQNKTGANKRFVRPWHEVEDLHPTPSLYDGEGEGRWRFYSKGGPFAPWWGNWNWVVDWSEDAREFYRTNKTSNLVDARWVERPGLVYSDFGGRRFAARYKPRGVVFDMTGPAIFVPDDDEEMLFGLLVILNSPPARRLLNAMNPTLHYQVRDLRNLPLVENWRALAQEAAGPGKKLVRAYRELHRGIEDDPLYDGTPVVLQPEILRLEADWGARICSEYGIEAAESPAHHVLGTHSMTG